MSGKIRWGVLSTAKIGTEKVIPAMQRGDHCEIAAVSSRDPGSARSAAEGLGIAKAYGSYESLLADPDIDAVYNPLPNHLHVKWSIRALEAGKHVLCEKPIGLTAAEGRKLADAAARHPELKVMEAFMYRHHPQWQYTKKAIDSGEIGDLLTIQSAFFYSNTDPANIRNIREMGGGGLMDIGCYNISLSRFLFGSEPRGVMGAIEYDPAFGTDRLCSGILQFEGGTSSFTCGTQASPYQRVNALGSDGRIEIEIPFNAPPDRPCRLWHQRGGRMEEVLFETCDQYTIQGDLFAKAVIEDTAVPTPIEDAVANMRVIEAIVRSAEENCWMDL